MADAPEPNESVRAVVADTGRKIDGLGQKMDAGHAEIMAELSDLERADGDGTREATKPVEGDET